MTIRRTADEHSINTMPVTNGVISFFKEISSLCIDGHDQRAKLFDTAVPQCLRHTQITPRIEQEIGIIWPKGKYMNSRVEKFVAVSRQFTLMR